MFDPNEQQLSIRVGVARLNGPKTTNFTIFKVHVHFLKFNFNVFFTIFKHLFMMYIEHISNVFSCKSGINTWVHSPFEKQNGVFKFLKTKNNNFGFVFILHYYSCNGLLYANR